MKSTLLSLLRTGEGEFVSGEKISDQLGCSRTAVWKHIDALRKEGYTVEAAPKKGYRLAGEPDTLSVHQLKSRLPEPSFVKDILHYPSIHSTQETAHLLASEQAEEGTIVLADEQTKGKGRLGRQWHSPPETGIWMSLILRPDIEVRSAPQLTLLTAVAVVRGIKESLGLDPEIKWPNDILFNGRKAAGILTEMQAEPDRVHAIIVGLGLNVNQDYFPDELADIATSLRLEKGEKVSRTDVLEAILKEWDWLYRMFLKEGFSSVKPLWEAHALTMGKEITARTPRETLKGVAVGIDDAGVLLLRTKDGKLHHIYSADIEV
ncbi:bifunctional biotin--[acetyl-CoA-carboxylase] synthetase/biotin operon repressor [Alteribacter lacisalsi]|uniref:Bifunctional ligase/repressor BirA n=1 Tax=Alteribacter lacisalsi TaxID=2045244 RepID=A0A2W0HLI0_9BACI|nr:biotin--[acetyl-CoA-carboxylase] ligase [Alteribacter lacisalsi]PYZ98395.1 bifunctional biotin--[acetyl-CoA-carboxylase] synthetase/biotin operon repressor [Alteribacter lacisalsi]